MFTFVCLRTGFELNNNLSYFQYGALYAIRSYMSSGGMQVFVFSGMASSEEARHMHTHKHTLSHVSLFKKKYICGGPQESGGPNL